MPAARYAYASIAFTKTHLRHNAQKFYNSYKYFYSSIFITLIYQTLQKAENSIYLRFDY